MIDVDAASVIAKFAKEIQKRALPLDRWPDHITATQHRNRDQAWQLLSALQRFMEHVKESDTHLTLLSMAQERGEERLQLRLAAVVRQEDKGYLAAHVALEALLKQFQEEATTDPRAVEYGNKLADARARRIASVADEKKGKRERRNAATRARRAAAADVGTVTRKRAVKVRQ